MSSGLIAAFLYSRVVKIPLLPLLVAYFGPGYTLLFTVYSLLVFLVEGIFIDKIGQKGLP